MSENIKIGIQVSSDGSLPKVEKEASGVHEQLAKAAASSEKLNNNLKASKALQAAAKQDPGMSGQDYNKARSVTGVSGAAARDFADQSRGLGGLVRLYATYAANVFAVSAAFTALKSAMDTTNMVAGLDQLGAATGRNLGSLSKRLVTLTDGAISFRDAMDAVAKTSSSGMASKDIERLAVVAKNASLALGVAMPDAINRLSRGISKLEPELLDELGIFTKIDPAVQAYARSVGKASSQLTDFERRQAFANAVLLEGEAKFGELATAAVNPYDRLLATLKNVSQEALSVVNKVLGPVVSLLASSPTALTGALAVLGTLLVRQAIPALTEFKAGIAASAETARELAKTRANDAILARKQQYDAIEAIIEKEADLQIEKADQVAAKLQASRAKSKVRAGGAAMELIDTAPQLRTKELYAQAQAEADLVDQEIKATNKRTKAGKEKTANLLEEKNAILATIAVAQQQQQIEESLEAKKNIRRKELDKDPERYSTLGLTLQASAAAQETATKKSIISNAAYNASLIGTRGAFVLLQADIEKSGLVLSAWDLKVLKSRAGLAIFIGVLGTLGSVINKALGALGLITAVVGIFDTLFSKASKEMDAFSSSLSKVDDAAANASRTLAFLDKKGGFATATIEGISSMANALNELSSAAQEAVASAKVAQAAMGLWDTIKDKFFSQFGGGIENNLAEKLAKDIRASLDILTTTGLDKEASEKFKKILNVNSLDTETVRKAILKLSEASKGDLTKALAESNTALNNSASRLQSFKSATEATTKAYQDFIQSTASNNPIFKLGTTLENLGKSMSDVFVGGAKEMEAAMLELAKSPEKGMLFGPEFTNRLVQIRQELLSQSEAVTVYQNRLNDLNKELEQTREVANAPAPTTSYANPGFTIPAWWRQRQAKSRVKELESDIGALQESANLLPTDKIEEARNIFVKGLNNAFDKGATLIATGLKDAAEKAQQTIAKAKLGSLTGEARAQEEARLAKIDIDLQIRAIDTNIDLILSQERLRASIDDSTAKSELAAAIRDKQSQSVINNLQSAANVTGAFKGLLGEQGVPNFNQAAIDRARTTEGGALTAEESAVLKARTFGPRNAIAAQQAARKEQEGAKSAADISGDRAIQLGRVEDQKKVYDLVADINRARLAELNTLTSISGVLTEQAVQYQEQLDKSILESRHKGEIFALDVAIYNARDQAAQKEKLEKEKTQVLERQALEISNQKLQAAQKLLQVELDTLSKTYALKRSLLDLERTTQSGKLEVLANELNIMGSIYGLSKESLITQNANLEAKKAFTDFQMAEQAAVLAFNEKDEAAQKRIASIQASGAASGQAEIDKIQENLKNERAILENTTEALDQQYFTRLKIIYATEKANLEQEKLNKKIQEINRRYEVQRAQDELQNITKAGNLDIQSQQLSLAAGLLNLSRDYVISQQANLDISKLTLDKQNALDTASTEFNRKKEEAGAKTIALQKIVDSTNAADLQYKDAAKKSIAEINAELDHQQKLYETATDKIKEEARQRAAILRLTRDTNLEQEKLNKAIEKINKQAEVSRSNADLEYARATGNIDIKIQELSLWNSLYGLSKQFVISEEAVLAKSKLILENNRARKAEEDEIATKRKISEEQIAALQNSTIFKDNTQREIEKKRIQEEFARQNQMSQNTLARLDLEFNNRTRILDLTTRTNLQQERYNELMTTSNNLANTLTSIFGQLGTSIGTLTTSFAEMAIATEKNAKNIAGLELSRDMETDAGVRKKLNDEIAKQRENSTKQELASYAKIAGATKTLFKEKTAAYKIFAATEKALQIATLALEAKTFAIKMGWLKAEVVASGVAETAIVGQKVAAAPAKVGADAPGILSSFANMGPVGYAIGAALVASLLAMAGGGGRGSAPSIIGAEQRQEVQGTAMGYDAQGNKVQVRRGVFGDENAKSESIANSLEIIKNNSVEGLAYDNRMLRALENLNEALNDAAKGLFGIRGLRAGTLTGVVEGTNVGNKGLFGIGGLFSSSVSKSIIDSGIQLRGSFYDLAKGVRGTINVFETVSTTVKKSGFLGIGGSTRTSVATEFRDLAGLDPKAFDSMVNTFNYAADLLYSVADQANVADEIVTNSLKSIQIDEMASLRGLTGEDFTKELGSVIGAVLDDASLVIFNSFQQYANFGEGMLETVIRVVDTNMKIDQALKNMGLQFDVSKDYVETVNGVTRLFGIAIGSWTRTIGKTSRDITEALAKAAGGLDKFLEQAEFFRTNFLSEAEQLAPVQKAVTAELARLGFASVDTRDEFKLLVQGLDLSTDAGVQTYQALVNLQEGFIKVTAAAEKQAEERKNLEKKLFALDATKQELRLEELNTLFEGNRELQKEIWLKEDQIAATKALQTNLQNTTKTIKSQITSLQDYRKTLLSGANSTLTATQQYTLAKAEVEALSTTIAKSANTPEEVEARSAAIGKLSSATDKWLTLSRSLYASGSQYTVDFNSVLAIIGSVGTSLETQLTDAEKQLTALETSNSFLETISSSTKTTAELLQTYLTLGGKPLDAPALATGTNYVPEDMMAQIHKGERIIPAADNFVLMSRMATADAYTRDMCQQLRQLNQKIENLEQTVAEGAVMNAQATDRNTQQIAQAVTEGSDKTIQVARIQNKAIIK